MVRHYDPEWNQELKQKGRIETFTSEIREDGIRNLVKDEMESRT
jgi:hypothetical protein